MVKNIRLKSGFLTLMIGVSLMGLAGCATTGSAAQNTQSEIGYEKFYDLKGDYKLIGKNNDVWLQKIDGSESRQITHTPNLIEIYAAITKDLKYIVYGEYNGEKRELENNYGETGGIMVLIPRDEIKDFRVNFKGDDREGKTQIHPKEADYMREADYLYK